MTFLNSNLGNCGNLPFPKNEPGANSSNRIHIIFRSALCFVSLRLVRLFLLGSLRSLWKQKSNPWDLQLCRWIPAANRWTTWWPGTGGHQLHHSGENLKVNATATKLTTPSWNKVWSHLATKISHFWVDDFFREVGYVCFSWRIKKAFLGDDGG